MNAKYAVSRATGPGEVAPEWPPPQVYQVRQAYRAEANQREAPFQQMPRCSPDKSARQKAPNLRQTNPSLTDKEIAHHHAWGLTPAAPQGDPGPTSQGSAFHLPLEPNSASRNHNSSSLQEGRGSRFPPPRRRRFYFPPPNTLRNLEGRPPGLRRPIRESVPTHPAQVHALTRDNLFSATVT